MAYEAIDRLRENIRRVYIGNAEAVDRLIACLLARGHVLIEDVPGVGKTLLATALARSIDCTFSRIQLTPDMLPGDVLGVSVYNRETGRFEFKRGPIFANIVLADEVNRTTPRTQSSLLEAMSEGTVSIDGHTMPLDHPFMVVATQNPYEFEGTYPLPENQLDRFLMQIRLGYPSPDDEARILDLRPSESGLATLKPVTSPTEVLALQEAVSRVRIDPALTRYAIALATATRNHPELQVGLSPRGSLALAQAARATALLNQRDYCIPEDIAGNFIAVSAHRVVTRAYVQSGDTTAGARIVAGVLESVSSPD